MNTFFHNELDSVIEDHQVKTTMFLHFRATFKYAAYCSNTILLENTFHWFRVDPLKSNSLLDKLKRFDNYFWVHKGNEIYLTEATLQCWNCLGTGTVHVDADHFHTKCKRSDKNEDFIYVLFFVLRRKLNFKLLLIVLFIIDDVVGLPIDYFFSTWCLNSFKCLEIRLEVRGRNIFMFGLVLESLINVGTTCLYLFFIHIHLFTGNLYQLIENYSM